MSATAARTTSSSAYVPELGDVVWLHFTPQSGHEQAGHRPALVLSPATYNRKVGLMLCCPLTTQVKGYPFEVPMTLDGQDCAVLSDQVKSLDWRAQQARKKGAAPDEVLTHVKARVRALLVL